MIYPEMIVFDFGNTLATQVGELDLAKGNEKVIELATKNIYNITGAELSNMASKLNETAYNMIAKSNLEINGLAFSRLLYSVAGLGFDNSVDEVYSQFCESALQFEPMIGAIEMFKYLDENNIKYAVLSNTIWSENVLQKYLKKLFPTAKFEFVMTSCDYLLCKPENYLFTAMINKTGATKDKVWFCGDLVHRDIEGAYQAGIKPILIDYFENYSPEGKYAQYQVPPYTTKISNLFEMIDLISNSK